MSTGSATTLWRAVDEVLARPVAVKILHPAADRAVVSAFLAAAIRAGRVSHPRMASVYDAAEEAGVAFVVSEWVDGVALAELLRGGPLPTERAVGLVGQAAQALAAVHAAGVVHGRLHAGHLLVGANGTVKLTDIEVAAVAAGTSGGGDPRAADVRALGGLLYAALTARWPPAAGPQGHAVSLPAQPAAHGRSVSPRQLRAGVPRDLDLLTMRLLEPDQHPTGPPLDTAARVAQALRTAPSVARVAPRPERAAAARRSPYRRLRWALPVAALAGVGVVAWIVGTDVGRLPGTHDQLPALVTSPSPGSGATASHVLRLPAVRDYDPEGDGSERPDLVRLAYDHDQSTAWQTATYVHNPKLGGLKDGVGLLVDFGRPTKVTTVSLALTAPGASLELRAGNKVGAGVAALPAVRTVSDTSTSVTLTPRAATVARYWLVWLTVLPPRGDGFGEGIAEMTFRG